MKKLLSTVLAVTMSLSALCIPSVMASEANQVYDEVKYTETCDTEKAGVSLLEGAPDGSRYYQVTGAGVDFEAIPDTSEDYMWELDIRFDAEGGGFTVKNKSNWNGSIKLTGDQLGVQTGGSSYTKYDTINTTDWYHIQLIGRYGTSDGQIDMIVYKWVNGAMEFVSKNENIPRRNNRASGRFTIEPGTSIDNLKATKLGADELRLAAIKTDLLAGESSPISYKAYREGMELLTPAVEWSVYDQDNAAPLEDSNITITPEGVLNIGIGAQTQNITVRATSTGKGNVYGSLPVSVTAVNTDDAKFDTLELSSDREYVRVGEPLQIEVTAKKNGTVVELEDGDLNWTVFDQSNIMEVPNQFITISNDGIVTVDERVISQKLTVRATNTDNTVRGAIPVIVKAADALEAGEEGSKDVLVAANACEDIVSGVTLTQGSWDGSNYYVPNSDYDFAGFAANTTEDMVIEADLQFNGDGNGWTVWDSGKGKQGMQIIATNGNLGVVQDSSKTPVQFAIEYGAWYKITIVARTGVGDTAYAKLIAYKYDADGNKVHPVNGTAQEAFVSDIPMRNLGISPANHISVAKGTGCDNVRMLKAVPDELTVSADRKTVFAGGKVQASCVASRKGVEMPNIDYNTVEWAIYDSENQYPIDDKNFSIDGTGLMTIDAMASAQDVYIRVQTKSGELYDSVKVTVQSSDIFEVKMIGLNKDNTKVLQLDVEKHFAYKDDVTFIIAVYGTDGAMKAINTTKMYGDSLIEGQINEVRTDFTLLSDFNAETDTIKVFVWTKLN